jgi:hypothetical protein
MGKERSKIDHSMSQQACMIIKTVRREGPSSATLRKCIPAIDSARSATMLSESHHTCTQRIHTWKGLDRLSVHLVNPSDNSFGTAVITPRWLFVLAAATPRVAGDPILVDESLEQIAPETIQPGDIVGISVHTGNALRGYEVGRMARSRGAWVVYGGIHATLFPEEALERGEGHAVVTGDGDVAWGKAVVDCMAGKPEKKSTKAGELEAASSWPRAGI